MVVFTPSRLALHSQLARNAHPTPELRVAVVQEEGILLGAFQRLADVPLEARASGRLPPVFLRGSGGAAVSLGAETVYLSLRLPHPGALTDADPPRLLNRYVRPLLRGLGSLGKPAHYFGRDWVSVGGRPVAAVTFAHDGDTGQAHVEAFVGVRRAPWPSWRRERGSFRGKAPGALAEVLGGPLSAEEVARRIGEAFGGAYGLPVSRDPLGHDEAGGLTASDATPWAATGEGAIGLIAAGPDAGGTFRVGGEILASQDALRDLAAITRLGEVESNVARVLGQVGSVVLGADAAILADVLRRALALGGGPGSPR